MPKSHTDLLYRTPQVSRSSIQFEYVPEAEHARLVELLRKAILQCDVRALIQLNEMIKDVRGT